MCISEGGRLVGAALLASLITLGACFSTATTLAHGAQYWLFATLEAAVATAGVTTLALLVRAIVRRQNRDMKSGSLPGRNRESREGENGGLHRSQEPLQPHDRIRPAATVGHESHPVDVDSDVRLARAG